MNIFTYGTLMIPDVMYAVTTRKFRFKNAILRGYARFTVKGESYPGIIPVTGAVTEGIVYFDVDALSLDRLDAFEGDLYQRTPVRVETKKEEILKVVKKLKNDAVIITHLVGVEEKESYTPPERDKGGYYGHYGWAYGYTHEPGFYRTHTIVRLATHLYDVKTEKLIWSGESESLDPGSTNQIIDDVIEVLIKDLQKNNLLPTK